MDAHRDRVPQPDPLDLLGDADPDVRLRAALELGEQRRADAAAALVDRFGRERDFAIRETLTWAVLRVRDAALPLVREALHSERWLARLQAAHTISKVGAFEDGVRLIPLLADPIEVVAARAYWAAAQCGDPAVVPALVAELSRGSSEHRNSLTVALSHFGEDAVPALAGALRHGRTAEVRRHAADTLALLGSPHADGAVTVLAEAVGDPDEAVRLAALNALGQLVVPQAWDEVRRHVDAPERRLRILAGRLLERRPTEAQLRRAALAADPRPLVATPPPDGPRSWPAPDPGLVTLAGGPKAAELAPKLALQVAVCQPRHLARADVPADELAAVHAAALDDARAQGKAEAVAVRIAAGRVEQYVHDTVFLEQVSVADPGALVRDLLFGTEVTIAHFERR